MVFESAYSTFSGVSAVFFWGNTLKLDLVLEKSVFQVLRAFVVQNVEVGWVTLVQESSVGLFPGIADAGSLSVGNGDSMNGIGVFVVEDKDVIVAAAGRDGEATGLIRVRLEMMLVVEERNRDLMRTGFKGRGNIIVVVGGVSSSSERAAGLSDASRTKVFCFLILVPECCGKGFGKMLGDQLGCETGESGKVTTTDGSY